MLVPVRRLPQSAGSRCGILNCWPGAAKSSSRYSPTWRERPCEKGFPVFRRLVSVSAVILGAGLVVTACSPVKLGSAAIVGNERITIATLDTEVTNLSQTVKLYQGTVQLSQAQQTQQTLTWLIRFKINEELARQAGHHGLHRAGAEGAGGDLRGGQGQRAGPGDPERHPRPHPGRQRDPAEPGRRGRPLPGHRRPVRPAGQRRAGAHQRSRRSRPRSAKLNKARCQAAKALKIQVNPQFGQLDYNQLAVVAAPGTVFRPAGPAPRRLRSRG